jgi:ABC-type Mn2+/Zn2+ transport system permease subunit
MRRALLELLLLGVAGSLVGSWVLLYELAYSTESLAHALFPGLVAAALLGLPLLAGGAVGVLVAAIAIAFVGRIPLVERDTGVAVVITSLFGLGVVLALSPRSPPGVESLLFGDLLGVTPGDLVISGCSSQPPALRS